MEQALDYAQNRVQFGTPILSFPRVADKIAMMAVEIMIARQLTYYAAREKDSGRRCDLEAGMAKLLAARVDTTKRLGPLQGLAPAAPRSIRAFSTLRSPCACSMRRG